MAMDLFRKEDGERWTCTKPLWEYILESAEKGGYKPQGTSQYDFDTGEPDDSWDSSDYVSKSGQFVHDEDAKNMGESLDKFMTKHQPTGTEKEIILSFVQWVRICKEGEEDKPYYPGFDIW